MRSALYLGTVMHQRLRPRRHRLSYGVFTVLLDLDELKTVARQVKVLGINRPGLLSFHERDHGDGRGSLIAWAGALLAEHGIGWDGGRIELLCYPRMLGFVFNPLSVYFAYKRDGALAGILYEVHNTHGERHTYVLPAGADRIVRHEAEKQFFVSPFMPMACTYRFRIAPPDRRVGISILEHDAEGLLLTATFNGKRRELTSAALLAQLIRFPLMTLGVVAAIHWEAVKLLLKGVPLLDWQPARRKIAASGAIPEPEPVEPIAAE